MPIAATHQVRKLFLSAPLPLTLADQSQTDTPLVLANGAFERLTGYRAEDIEGRNCRFLQGGIDQPEARGEIRAAMAERREVQVVLKNRRHDGTVFENLLFLYPVAETLILGSQFELPADNRVESSIARHRELVDTINGIYGQIQGHVLKASRMSSDTVARTVRFWMEAGR